VPSLRGFPGAFQEAVRWGLCESGDNGVESLLLDFKVPEDQGDIAVVALGPVGSD